MVTCRRGHRLGHSRVCVMVAAAASDKGFHAERPAGRQGNADSDATARSSSAQAANTITVAAFIDLLSQEDRMLIILQGELYEGDWDAMLADLKNRLDGKPYIFKLANRIRDDISRIERLRAFEAERKIRLADYVKPPS